MRSFVQVPIFLSAGLCALSILASSAAVCGEGLDPEVLKRVKAATVYIRAESRRDSMQGSGFLAASDIVVTNAHVLGIEHAQHVPNSITLVFNSGEGTNEFSAAGTLICADLSCDLAFVKVVKEGITVRFPEPLEMAASATLRETLPIYIVGYPFGNALATERDRNPQLTIGPGSVSSLRKNADGVLEGVQLNGNLNPGNSGGPIVDTRGNVVAVAVATIRGTQIGMSIPGERVKDSLNGRVTDSKYRNIIRSLVQNQSNFTFDVEAETMDPRKRLAAIRFYWWYGKPGETRPVDKIGGLPAHGAPNDTHRMSVGLMQDREGQWKAEVRGVLLPPGKVPFGQIGYTSAGGEERLTAAAMILTDYLPDDMRKAAEQKNTAPVLAKSHPNLPPVAVPRTRVPVVGKPTSSSYWNNYMSVNATAERKELGRPKVRQILAAPTGAVLYTLAQNSNVVEALDPESFAVTDRIRFQGVPSSIWCDSASLLAVVPDAGLLNSGKIAIHNLTTKKTVYASPGAVNIYTTPVRIMGRAPSGEYMTLWKRHTDYERCLALIDDTGNIRVAQQGNFDWAVYANGGERILTLNAPSHAEGPVSYFDTATKKSVMLPLSLGKAGSSNKYFGLAAGGTRVFMTSENHNIGISCGFPAKPIAGYSGRTFLFNSTFEFNMNQFNGTVIAAPAAMPGLLVAWVPEQVEKNPTVEIRYYRPQDSRVERIVAVKNMALSPKQIFGDPYLSNAVFLPGHELFIYLDPGDDSAVQVVRCGPLATLEEKKQMAAAAKPPAAAGSVPAATPPPAFPPAVPFVEVEPPAKAFVGEKLVFTPSFQRPANVKKVEFQLKKTVKGLAIDHSSGMIVLTPTPDQIGSHYISIVADTDGVVVPVAGWFLEIAPKP